MKTTPSSRLIALAGVLLSASLSQASVLYNVSMDTSPLIGHAAGPFSLTFQFTDGSLAGDSNNTVVLSNFQFGAGGSASGSPSLFGGATGSLASGVTLLDSSFFSAFTEQFTPGSLLSFSLQVSTNVDAGGTPDEFSFFILDNTLTELPTLGIFDLFAVLDIDSANPVLQAFDSDSSRSPAAGGSGITMAAPQLTAATPEPSSFILLGIGLAFQISRRLFSRN
jgi:hypothetical protein